MGLMLDSGVLIRAVRDGLSAQRLFDDLQQRFGLMTFCISVVTVAELAHGVHRGTAKHRQRQNTFLKVCLNLFVVHDLTTSRALEVGRIDAELALAGFRVAFEDLVIGVTALTLDYAILTNNPRHFDRIPGLVVHSL